MHVANDSLFGEEGHEKNSHLLSSGEREREGGAEQCVREEQQEPEMASEEAVWLLLLLSAHQLLSCVSAIDRSQFPPNFLFGTSTSAYQVPRMTHRTCKHAVAAVVSVRFWDMPYAEPSPCRNLAELENKAVHASTKHIVSVPFSSKHN